MSRPRLFCSEPLSCCTKGNCRDGSRCQYPCCDVSGRRYQEVYYYKDFLRTRTFFFYNFHRVFSGLLSSVTISSFQHLSRAIRIRITEIWRSILAPMENTSMTSFLTRFCLKANQETKKIVVSIPFEISSRTQAERKKRQRKKVQDP